MASPSAFAPARSASLLAAWGFTAGGGKVLLGLMAGSKEDAETVTAFFQDMRARGLGDPLLVISDGEGLAGDRAIALGFIPAGNYGTRC